MAAATKIEIILKSVEVLEGSNLVGPGKWSFTANAKIAPSNTVNTFSSSKTFEAKRAGQVIKIKWKQVIEIDPADKTCVIEITGKDEDLLKDNDLGKVKLTLNTPIIHDYDIELHSSKDKFSAQIQVKIKKLEGMWFKRGVSTIRTDTDSDEFTTIHDEMLSKCVQICPVTPVPWAKGLPPLAKGVKPLSASPQENLGIGAAHTKPNSLVNPCVIVALNPADDDFDEKVARIHITQFMPADLDLSKLIWKTGTDNLKLYNGKKGVTVIKGGRDVKAYGVLKGDSDEIGEINVHWDSEGEPLLAKFKAWVGKPKQITTRANIIKTTTPLAQNPTTTPQKIKDHFTFTNVVLWQAGIQLIFDTDETVFNEAVKKDTGIFEINSATNYTFNVTKNGQMAAPLLNQRSGVYNIAYMHSCAGKPNLLGSASDRMLSEAEADVNITETPSVSWVRPTGVFPDDPAKKVTMQRMGPSVKRGDDMKGVAGDKNLDTVSSCIITDRGTIPGSITLAHETGHVIGIHHRGKGGNHTPEQGSRDKMNHLAGPHKDEGHPYLENVMCYGSNSVRQDIDLIQAQVIRGHKLLNDSPVPPIPPPPPPKAKKPVPKKPPIQR